MYNYNNYRECLVNWLVAKLENNSTETFRLYNIVFPSYLCKSTTNIKVYVEQNMIVTIK